VRRSNNGNMITTFLTVSPLYDRAHEGLMRQGDPYRRRSNGLEVRSAGERRGGMMKRYVGGRNRGEEWSKLVGKVEVAGERHGGVRDRQKRWGAQALTGTQESQDVAEQW
jgi:hypothetical protein